jgi:hypothetical protein
MNRGVITTLRDFVPLRPLGREEAMRIAELQALRFLSLSGITRAPVPERIIEELPRVQVERITPFPASGASHWASQRWLVVLNASEPSVRQRFTLCHETKHVLDHRFAKLIYSSLPEAERRDQIEQICDYFAGCLLMPRPWVKWVYGSGVQRLPDLARHFDVSQAAMQVRLSQIGLTEPTPRCAPNADDWQTDSLWLGKGWRYHRGARPVLAAPIAT